ncbi:hypothetical protein G6L94_30605 [Agrobacterium rhizogenes]|jgi:hypothetical protein|uniref:Uncharacterized protein n=2 Tax=Rhizobium rhizogenes TaxID=359 RepID=B9JLR7_RHIR8|nr:hypothetical protein [Rhizobium rhizogenes]ACM30803.1 conserved hypothetical protein [Rhizobium rhizogenes K84]KAA6474589.1 hypothetical protein DXT98_30405 [Agrobacterium sp. ICMP 7243]OCJ00036.1 hypothetical protein A6U85_31175 [Agrobacterium sp. 13-626]OCJ20445.1 hypothetical protein A6U88_31170 [Agrobacterium sp. B131/95]OCJ24167.1 hypothetical protein A6U89_30920 [Agrobacterium sp. B133/95]
MTENTSDPTLVEREIAKVISRTDKTLAATVSRALEDATKQAAEDMRAIGQEDAVPAMQYFAAVVHQRMYCLMCGADPDTFEGGNPETAYHVIRNSQNIAKHYWSADIEPYPAK